MTSGTRSGPEAGRKDGAPASAAPLLEGGSLGLCVGCHETQHPYFFTWWRLTDGRDCRPRAAPGRRGVPAEAAGWLAQLQVKWLGGGRLGAGRGRAADPDRWTPVNTVIGGEPAPVSWLRPLSMWGAAGCRHPALGSGQRHGDGASVGAEVQAEDLAWSPAWSRLSITGWAVTARPQPFLGTSLPVLCQALQRRRKY